MMLRWWANRTLLRKLDRLEVELRKRDATIAVLEAERDAMAAVIARDRQRVQAESASYARQRAEAEGVSNERTDASVHRFGT